MNWLHYLVEANLYLAIFYLVYYLLLSNQTWYSLNRIYLLVGSVLAFIIPFLQLGFLKPPAPKLLTITPLQPVQYTPVNIIVNPAQASQFTWQNAVVDAYLAGSAILFIVFMLKLYKLFKLIQVQNSMPGEQYKLVYIDDSNTAFSFFNFLFIGTKTEKTDTIIRHELVHITQKHSADIIFIELLKIINWFNPFVYLLQYSLKTIHEYIADEKTAMVESDAISYSTFLVNNAYGLGGSSITHSFFNYNLLKKRIIMLNQQRSGKLARLRYLVAIPVCAGMLCASTLAFSKNYAVVDVAPVGKTDTPKYVHTTVSNHVINWDNAYTTTKGYKVTEEIHTNNGVESKKVVITDKDGSKHTYYSEQISAADRAMLYNKYGYKFPNAPTVHELSTPPTVNQIPAPSPAPTVKQLTLVKPRAHAKPTFTKTGYKYQEDGYTVNGKTDFRVIITEKNGDQKAYFKSHATATDLKLLKEKYGYTFPTMEIYTSMPPPAPAKPRVDNRPPPPPPAPPVKKDAQSSKNTSSDTTVNGKSYKRLVNLTFTLGFDTTKKVYYGKLIHQ